MAKKLQMFRETALPAVLEPCAIYLVAPASNTDYVEFYVTNADGTAARRTPKIEEIQAMIDASVSSKSSVSVVEDITERDSLVPDSNIMVLVADATGDTTVKSGSATYVYNVLADTWTKITEHESLDVSFAWASLTDKPTSAVADIDDAVTKRHSHANLASLNKVGEDASGNFTYNGTLVGAYFASTNW